MKEHPILFIAPMVRAWLAGMKTQTRRIMKHQWTCDTPGFRPDDYTIGIALRHCRYGRPGHRLWVKETWHHSLPIGVPAVTDEYKKPLYVDYRADVADELHLLWKWRPSIFMPRWASRITLEITDVRVQRLQDISEEDAIAEGSQIPLAQLPKSARQAAFSERQAYSRIWESINGAGSWDANPWVWAITFKEVPRA